jgi:hypothetical protein
MYIEGGRCVCLVCRVGKGICLSGVRGWVGVFDWCTNLVCERVKISLYGIWVGGEVGLYRRF